MMRFFALVFALAQHLTALVWLAFFTRRIVRNLRFLRGARAAATLPPVIPRVSVLVPARNEARSIVACVESLARQEYSDFEVIVLNDQSTDATGSLLDELARQHANVSVLHGRENPPPGWNGKSFACQRLADHATGEWLLFTDADTIHTPQSIARGIAQAHALHVDLLSALPRQLTPGWSEKIVVSFVLDFLPLLLVDLSVLSASASASADAGSSPGNTAAIGQYLLTRASTYREQGGHKAIAQVLVDDFALAAHLRATGSRIALVDGTDMLACRMYRTPREVWQGFSKNVLDALETSSAAVRPSGWQLLFAWSYACVFLMPWYRLPFSADKRMPILEVGWLLALRALVNGHFARPRAELAATPLAAASVVAFALHALARRQRLMPVTWKDRDYSPAPQPRRSPTSLKK